MSPCLCGEKFFQVGQESRCVGVVADEFVFAEIDRVDRADGLGGGCQFVEQGNHGLLVRDGDVESVQIAGADAGEQIGQALHIIRMNRE